MLFIKASSFVSGIKRDKLSKKNVSAIIEEPTSKETGCTRDSVATWLQAPDNKEMQNIKKVVLIFILLNLPEPNVRLYLMYSLSLQLQNRMFLLPRDMQKRFVLSGL